MLSWRPMKTSRFLKSSPLRIASILFLCTGLATALSACGDHTTEDTSLTYHYQETVNGASCDTGIRTFSSVAELCVGLQNRTLNSSCAVGERQQLYRQKCSGSFTEI